MNRKTNTASAYIWSLSGLAEYMGVSRPTLWRIRNSNTRTDEEKKLLSPRIIDGSAAFSKSNIDKFMAAEMTPAGASIHDPFSHQHE